MAKTLSLLLVAGIVALALSFAGCSKKEEPRSEQPSTPSAPAPPAAPAVSEAPTAPAVDASKDASVGDAAKGKGIFANFCSSCHGNEGKGDGAAAAALNPKPKDLTDKAYVSNLKDDYLYDIVAKGGASVGKSAIMPPFGGNLKDQDIRDVVAFIRSLTK